MNRIEFRLCEVCISKLVDLLQHYRASSREMSCAFESHPEYQFLIQEIQNNNGREKNQK